MLLTKFQGHPRIPRVQDSLQKWWSEWLCTGHRHALVVYTGNSWDGFFTDGFPTCQWPFENQWLGHFFISEKRSDVFDCNISPMECFFLFRVRSFSIRNLPWKSCGKWPYRFRRGVARKDDASFHPFSSKNHYFKKCRLESRLSATNKFDTRICQASSWNWPHVCVPSTVKGTPWKIQRWNLKIRMSMNEWKYDDRRIYPPSLYIQFSGVPQRWILMALFVHGPCGRIWIWFARPLVLADRRGRNV